MPAFIDITGQKFGRLTATECVGKSRWRFSCDCGGETITSSNNVKNGHTQSCGCYRRERAGETHRKYGKSYTKVRNAWMKMRDRCYDPKSEQFRNYGGRGISVADIWQGEHGFKNFYAHIGEPPSPKHTLDRINTDGNYEPGNVRWSTQKVQQNNRRNNRLLTCFGRTMTASQWADDTGIDVGAILLRLDRNWPIDKALVLPVKVWDHELGKLIRPSTSSALHRKAVVA